MCYPLCYVLSILQCMLCGMHYMLSTICHVPCAMHNVLCAMPYVPCATHSHDRCYVLCITCYALYMHYALCMMCSVLLTYALLAFCYLLCAMRYGLCGMCYALCPMLSALHYSLPTMRSNRVHGFGFTVDIFGAACNARIGFGTTHSVPCWRISDTLLGCRAPAHPPATVAVRLLGCEAQGQGGGAEACFEYRRLEHMYDAIFASTNSYCPINGGAVDDGGAHSSDGSTSPSENGIWPPPRFGF